ncbi:BRISC and BRCA1-A complex member 1 [Quillaja saponaria]|uniref:BRISC and BRCA1-A complex member 1 n=1 Tax=Quillaja saponaria TaxID=32244 RepID=A0AAD7PKD0_QUISA|nr:BRISC and BRCA1-A complex member 1 [Quillaja saponaria]
MEVIDDDISAVTSRYTLTPGRIGDEDILFCIDVDPDSLSEMKANGVNGRPITRLDSIKQAILLFVNAKLTINPEHRFAFTILGKSASWLRKEFSSEVESAMVAVRGLSAATSSFGQADLTNLFKVAAHEAKKSRMQNRIFRVVLIYCRSSIRPQHQWPLNQKLFTLDVMYLHDKPGPDNCPQEVYDALVDAIDHVSEYEGYIFETGQGLQRVLFRHMCVLLSHPQQRCGQDYIDIPKSLVKKTPASESMAMATEDVVPVSSQ